MLDALDLLKTAVSIPSVSGQEAELAHYFQSQLESFCDEAFVDESGSAVGKWGRGPLKVYFLGHIDTVPGLIPVRIEDGKLFGRGSVDAKGSFCTAVAAASHLHPTLKNTLTLKLIGATEEEAPTSKGARHAVKTYSQPDLVIIGEPSGWDALTLGYKGRLVAQLSVAKDNFHSAGKGTTAAEDLIEFWLKAKTHATNYNADIKGIFDALQVSMQNVSSTSDGLLQRAEATLGYRLPPTITPEALKKELSDLLPEIDLVFKGAEIAYRSEKDTPLTRALRIAIRQHGGKPRFKVKTGTSDMNVVAPHWNVPMLAYGPGDSGLDHTPNEHLDLADYKRAVAILTTAFEQLAETYNPASYKPDNS